MRTDRTRAQVEKRGHDGESVHRAGKNKTQQQITSHSHSRDTDAQREPTSSSSAGSSSDTTLVLMRPVKPKRGNNGVSTKACSEGKEVSSSPYAPVSGKDATTDAEAAAPPPLQPPPPPPRLAPPPVASPAGPSDGSDPAEEGLPWLVDPVQRFRGLDAWRRICERHRDGIRHDLVGRGLLSASAEKALLGDKILDLHLVLSMMNLEDPRVISGEMMWVLVPGMRNSTL